MRRLPVLPIALALLVPLPARGGEKVHLFETPRDFAAGELLGVRLLPDGGIAPAPERRELARIAGESLGLSVVRSSTGDLWVGTALSGTVWKVPKGGGAPVPAATMAGVATFALAAGTKGEVWAAASPGGAVVRVDRVGADGRPAVVFETGQSYVWALVPAPDGALWVATGPEGKLFRVAAPSSPAPKGELVLDSAEPNIRALALAADGTLFAGTDGHALVYRIAPGRKAEVLGDAPNPEVAALLAEPDGSVLVLSTAGEGVREAPPATTIPAATAAATGSGTPGDVPAGTVSVSVDTSLGSVASSREKSSVSLDLTRFRADGALEPVATLDGEIGYALVRGGAGRPWLGTGPKGRVYELDGRQLLPLRDVPEKSVVALLPGAKGEATLALAAEGPTLWLLGPGAEPDATWISPVRSASRRVAWGGFRRTGTGDGQVRLSVRGGNAPAPDESWTDWVELDGAEGTIGLPAGRYLQAKVRLAATGREGSPTLRRLSFHGREPNLPPKLEIPIVHDPGVVFVRGSYNPGNVVLEVANPDDTGMFTVVGEAAERSESGKKMFRKGFRTLTWKGDDPDGDALLADVEVRRADPSGRPAGEPLVVATGLEPGPFSFDATALPEGEWIFRVVLSDRKAHPPAEALSDAKETAPVIVDHGAPEVRLVSRGAARGATIPLRFDVTDRLSPILRVEASVDGGRWVELPAPPGSSGLRSRPLSLDATGTSAPPRIVVVRAIDTSYNVATVSVLDLTTERSPSGR